ncbi:hypothetical protein MAR_020490 [Mya arenaria]|uniref:Uncharacterized protein n=1 Tax=Mya arenaria TaxID=6604 RepID=A0ABY7E879_MYAAR|nr:hypothetical protein MAR_020490 [Mya arenaria]
MHVQHLHLSGYHTALLKGSIDVRVHDEAYARVHLGLLNYNIDFFVARICFKGGAKYELNILKDLDIENFFQMAKQFIATIKNVISAIRKGVTAFRNILNSNFPIKEVVEAFVDNLEELPHKCLLAETFYLQVSSFGSRIHTVIKKISVVNIKKLPPFIVPVKQFVDESVKLYEKVRSDVMTFYNTIVEAVKIKIPHSAVQIYEAIKDIIDGFMDMIYTSIKQLNETLQEVKQHTFISGGMTQYFFDLKQDIGVLLDLFKTASNALFTETKDWLEEEIDDNDLVAKATNGTQTTGQIRKLIVSELREAVNNVFEPINSLLDLGGDFLETFMSLFNSYISIKDAFQELKQGYEDARSMVAKIFGTKCHRDFPRTKRERGGGCDGDGFYPARLQNEGPEYTNDGIDILLDENSPVVAPFAAKAILSGEENEIILLEIGSLPPNSEMIISNIKPLDFIKRPTDEDYLETRVSGGDTIGFANASPCKGYNHIHISLKRDGGFVDPSDVLEKRPIELPKWKQICDDYKLVYKGQTLKVGSIVGLDGRKEEDTSQHASTDGANPPDQMDETNRPDADIEEIKASFPFPKGAIQYQIGPSNLKLSSGRCHNQSICGCSLLRYFSNEATGQSTSPGSSYIFPSPMISSQLDSALKKVFIHHLIDISPTGSIDSDGKIFIPLFSLGNPDSIYNAVSAGKRKRRSLSKIGSSFKMMLENIQLFLKKFKIRKIKMGAIIDFLDEMDLHKTKEELADLMKTIKRV